MHLLIDSDPLVYRAGFAAEKLCRGVVYTAKGSDEEHFILFEPDELEGTALQQKKRWLEEMGDSIEITDEFDEVVPEPVSNALSTCRAMIRDCIFMAMEHFGLQEEDITYQCYLSGPGNFRMGLATVAPYKGNRKEGHKPYHYSAIRQYLQQVHGAKVVEGREADDAVSIAQYEGNGKTVICTFDKDLDQVPGWHYDYNKHSFYYTTEDEGQSLFYKQVLSGDKTDNIPGVYRVGDVRAAKIVDEYLLDNPADWKGLWQVILRVYEKSIEQYGEECPYWDLYQEGGAETVALEMARLVKMQEYPEQLWCPPGEKDLLMIPEIEL